jgi:hypothetical protein
VISVVFMSCSRVSMGGQNVVLNQPLMLANAAATSLSAEGGGSLWGKYRQAACGYTARGHSAMTLAAPSRSAMISMSLADLVVLLPELRGARVRRLRATPRPRLVEVGGPSA